MLHRGSPELSHLAQSRSESSFLRPKVASWAVRPREQKPLSERSNQSIAKKELILDHVAQQLLVPVAFELWVQCAAQEAKVQSSGACEVCECQSGGHAPSRTRPSASPCGPRLTKLIDTIWSGFYEKHGLGKGADEARKAEGGVRRRRRRRRGGGWRR